MESESTVDLSPYFAAIRKRWLIVVAAGVVAATIGCIYTLVIAPTFRASALLLLPLPTTATPTNPLLIGSADPLAILQGILVSYPNLKAIADKNGKSIERISDDLIVTTDGVRMQISVAAISSDREYALGLVTQAVEGLEFLSAKADLTMAEQQARNYITAVAHQEKQVAEAEQAILVFQENSQTAPDPTRPLAGTDYTRRLLDLDFELGGVRQSIQVKRNQTQQFARSPVTIPSGLDASKKWRDRLIELDYQLRVERTKRGPRAPEVVAIERRIEVTENQITDEIRKELLSVERNLDPELAQLEARRLVLESQREFLVEKSSIAPKEAIELQRLLRELSIREDVLKNLRTYYETERNQAMIERVKWSMLAEPYIDPRPTNKSFLRNSLIGGFFGVLVACIAVGRSARPKTIEGS